MLIDQLVFSSAAVPHSTSSYSDVLFLQNGITTILFRTYSVHCIVVYMVGNRERPTLNASFCQTESRAVFDSEGSLTYLLYFFTVRKSVDWLEVLSYNEQICLITCIPPF